MTTWSDIRPERAGRALAALLLAPLALRVLLLWDRSVWGSLQDLRGLLSDLAIALLLLPIVLLGSRVSRWIGVAIVAVWTLLQYANYETVSELGSLASVLDLRFLGNSTFLLGSAVAVARPVALGLLLIAGALLVAWAPRPAPWRSSGLCVVGALALLGALSVWPWTDAVAVWRQTSFVQQNLGLLASQGSAIGRTAAPEFPDPPSAMFALSPGLHADLNGESLLPNGRGRAKNVLLIVLESVAGAFVPTLAADHGYSGLFELPELEELASKNLSYSTFINHNRKTNRGLYALICGEIPNLLPGTPKMSVHASGGWQRCLPEVLREVGFKTVYMQSPPLAFMLKDQFMPRAGFDLLYGYDHFETMNAYARSHWGVDDRAFFEKTLETVTELHGEEEPFFATLLTVGTHHPFVFPRGYEGGTYGRRRRALRYADLAVGEFVRGLKERGVLDDTLVLISSDESAGMESKNAFKPLEGIGSVTEDLSQNWGILVVLGPEELEGRVREPFAQMDIPVSVLDYLGHGDLGEHLFGRSVFRRYADPRPMFFANTNLLQVGGLDTEGNLVHCGAVWGVCRKYALHERQVFGNVHQKVDYDEKKDGIFYEMARRSVRANRVHAPRTDYKLLVDPRVTIDQPSKQVIHGGQYLDLAKGQWMEVEIEVEAHGSPDSIVNFWHYAKSGAQTWTLERDQIERSKFWRSERLRNGQTLKIRYTLVPKRLMQGVRAQSAAELVRGDRLELDFKKARLSVRWSGDRPEPGLQLEQWEVSETR